MSALVKSTPPANGHRRPVVCVNTGQRFPSMTRAGAWAGVSSSTVRWAVVTGGCAGRCPDGTPAKWAADGWLADVKPEVVYTLRFADGAVFVGHSLGEVRVHSRLVRAHGPVVDRVVVPGDRRLLLRTCAERLLAGDQLVNGGDGPAGLVRRVAGLLVEPTVAAVMRELDVRDGVVDAHRVYLLTHPSGAAYVGSTDNDVLTRWRGHAKADTRVGRCIRSLGEDGWRVRILSEHPSSAAAVHAEELETRARQAAGQKLLNTRAGNRRTAADVARLQASRSAHTGRRVWTPEQRRRVAWAKRHRVQCVQTGATYCTIKAAARAVDVPVKAVSAALYGGTPAGWSADGQPLTWRFVGKEEVNEGKS